MAMTPGYAFTDYKSQGQTIEYVLVDLEPLLMSALTPFNACVALSHSRGRGTIRLLRDSIRSCLQPTRHNSWPRKTSSWIS
ncbi:hypothetical protein B0H17DRAFT_1031152 [Mycena rosella]|uniref:Uncharacterized protein n=1 Tax=Mycena rosella TaxID=1033263 RepID=A0AAD7H0D8_MYCRO|nr:hypothetical protein B0H17DRAFT_1031152 [Mycena rosella]